MAQTTIPKIQRMATEEFRRCYKNTPFNPDGRTKPAALKYLRESMRQYGFWTHAPIRVIGKYIVDGNGRLEAALLEKVPNVYYIQVEGITLDELYAVANGTQKAHTVRQAGEAVRKGLKVAPPNRQRILHSLAEVAGGWKQMRELLEKDTTVSPGIVLVARRIANYCYLGEEDNDLRNEFIVRAITWLSHHKITKTVTQAIEQKGVSPEVLYDRILEDKPIKSRWE